MSARLTDIWVVGKSPTRGKRLPQTFAVSHALGFAKRLIPRLLTFLGLHMIVVKLEKVVSGWVVNPLQNRLAARLAGSRWSCGGGCIMTFTVLLDG